ncbi:vascular endothelial growth factor B [Spea bombifrons]|uniref:vascular endothelial growth factor B n=1 Tax=Spea bombifrons TaxID=233779 RepID=UPI0023491A14|nr:vascular endothelial growth factor B [Spea bombifrons]
MESSLARSAIWLVVLLTCTLTMVCGLQTQSAHKFGEGLSIMDLYNRSQCQPRWVLLNILVEFPQFAEFLFLPSCVSVLRCTGCCLDEGLSCVPTKMHNITMQVIKTKLLQSEFTEIGITQHTRCQCRPKDRVLLKANRISVKGEKETKKNRGKGKKERGTNKSPRPLCLPCDRRKILNPVTCKCVCHLSNKKCTRKGQRFNKEQCRCEKVRS